MAPNALEAALEEATRDPGARPAFYRQLLESEVVVLLAPVHDGSSRDGMGLITWTRSDGVAVIPFFSSLAVCQRSVTKPGATAIVPARSLFQAAQTFSMHMHLNPHHDFGREFVPEELASLLAYGTINQGVSKTVLEAAVQVAIRAPQEALADFQAALASLFTSSSQVRAAYLFEMEHVDPPAPAALIVGVECPYDEALMHAIGTVATETYLGRLPIDACFLSSEDARLAILQQAEISPFFERSWEGMAQRPPATVQ
jgi:hypothetical protein